MIMIYLKVFITTRDQTLAPIKLINVYAVKSSNKEP